MNRTSSLIVRFILVLLFFEISTTCFAYSHEIRVNRVRQLFTHVIEDSTTCIIIKDINLSGADLLLPKGCTLIFKGGGISNGRIIAEDLKVSDWSFSNVKFMHPLTVLSPVVVPIENAKEFIEEILSYKDEESVEPTVFLFSSSKRYNWDGVLNIDRKNVTLSGGGTIEGHIHLGIPAIDFIQRDYGSYVATSHSNIIVSDLRFSKYKLYGDAIDNSDIVSYIETADVKDEDNISLSIINACNVKISNCFFDNVPYPIVYTPNNQYVNQNVRRLNVSNCDFERCKIAVYAPTNTNNSLEYGDLMFTGNNVYPTYVGLVVSNIDGFKCIGNTFSTCSRNQNGANIIAYRPGQVMISNNSFYGEYNQNSICLYDMGTGIVHGNLFSSQGIGAPPTTHNSIACLLIKQNDKVLYTPSVEIANNLFTNVNRLPIYIEGDVRNFNIVGNSLDGPLYESSRRTLYFINNKGPVVGVVQPNVRSANMLEDKTGTLCARMKAIHAMQNGNTLYPERYGDMPKYEIKLGNIHKSMAIKSISKCQYIAVVTFEHIPNSGVVTFVVNGLQHSINVGKNATIQSLLQNVKEIIDNSSGVDLETYMIDGVLWIISKTQSFNPVTPIYEVTSEAHTSMVCLYQNMGYRVIWESSENSSQSFEDVHSGLKYIYSLDDTFYVFEKTGERSFDAIKKEIKNKIYPDR